MFEINAEQVDLVEVKALIDVTEQFVTFATELWEKGDISKEEYDSMTILKREFLSDIKARYL